MNFNDIAHYMINNCSNDGYYFVYQACYESYLHRSVSCLRFHSEKKYFVIQELQREDIENGSMIIFPQRSAIIDLNHDISSTLELLKNENMLYAFQLLKELISVLNSNYLESTLPTSDVVPKIKL